MLPLHVLLALALVARACGLCFYPNGTSEEAPSCGCEATWHAAMTRDFEKRLFASTRNPVLQYSPGRLKPAPPEREPLVVHVGKTCGTSLQSFLGSNGVAHSSVHVHPVPLEVIARYGKVIVPVRDPIARLVSAFNFQFETQPHGWYKQLYKCFRTVDRFALALDVKNECGQVARRTMKSPPVLPAGHITSGLCYYLGGMLDILRAKQVFVVRSKHCESDTRAAMQWLGHPINRPEMPRNSSSHISHLLSLSHRPEMPRKLGGSLGGEHRLKRYSRSGVYYPRGRCSRGHPPLNAFPPLRRYNRSDVFETHLSREGMEKLKPFLLDEYRYIRALAAMSVNNPKLGV